MAVKLLSLTDSFPVLKLVHCCGHIQDMPLKERVFNCGNCGVSIDRDLNASLNLEKQALVVS